MAVTCLVVMGVSGAGKSTIAGLLAERLGWPMAEADDFHSASNVAKMREGEALTDADRAPWLRSLREWIEARTAEGRSSVMACSALRHRYRDVLRGPDAVVGEVRFVHLSGAHEVIGARLDHREGHFMPAGLLDSQEAALEPLGPDEDGVVVDVAHGPQELVRVILAELGIDPEEAKA
ncbi:gluconokinase [Glycomyces paridis]|uniref:Gluconokinase n=1 Tax=Glycomyces paridis TaxID=2126555 RepID=A0A4S8PFB2_9ACTN|nr:gluconokinase [Glycomyces paridis]THV29090.1 gluconokinase [Glycomyces paridis]